MDSQSLAEYLESSLLSKIPLVKAMGIRVAGYDGSTLVLRAPLWLNVNDKGTAFGGSLYSLAVLAGWGLLSIKLREEKLAGDVVIHESSVNYRLPVTGELEAKCSIPGEAEYSRFVDGFRAAGKGRIALEVRIMKDSRAAVKFAGNYVAYATEK
ncbi:MAG TPA: YiiD C-terminal domain-containing protein [Geobacteraceae bacterium]|nr:YiiD C-terminal domain-containing protein [Geobacteraceae bacterium]